MSAGFIKPTGELNARIHGAALAMERRAANARLKAQAPEFSVEYRASLRGKAKAYTEAAVVLRALEHGRPLDRSRSKSSRRWKWWR